MWPMRIFLQRLRVEFARGSLVHRQNLPLHRIALEPLLDEIHQRHLLIALLAGDEVFLRREPLPHGVEVLHRLAAVRAHIPPVARNLAAIPSEMAVGLLDEDRLQLVRHFLLKVEADRRRAVARLRVVQAERQSGSEFCERGGFEIQHSQRQELVVRR